MTDTNPDLYPPLPSVGRSSDEMTTLVEMLEYFRAVLARKGSGLTDEQLTVRLAPSDLSIGALLYHMAFVEDIWFNERFLGEPACEPWASADWENDNDWEITTSRTMTSAALFDRFNESVERARAAHAGADSLDQMAAKLSNEGEPINLRWIMVHMIEEYARHCGHADLIRESIDGVVDD